MTVNVTHLVADALRSYLLAKLPAAVAVVNATRAPMLMAAFPGQYTMPAGSYSLAVTGFRDGTDDGVAFVNSPHAPIVATAAQFANIFNSSGLEFSSFEAFDSNGTLGLRWRDCVYPTPGNDMTVAVKPYDPALAPTSTGSLNSIFGWDAGGESVAAPAIIAPGFRGVTDGYPVAFPDLGGGFWVIIADRKAVPVGGSSLRRDSWDVEVTVHVANPSFATARHRTREPISACLRSIEEVLLTSDGRQLGRSAIGDIQKVEVVSEEVHGASIQFEEFRNAVFDTATLVLSVRVFQRPSNS